MEKGWLFGAVVIGAVTIGASGIAASFYGSFEGREIVRAFSEALFVAGFLSGTVDRYIKWRMLREVAQDVSKYLIGWQLPKEMQDRISQLMKTDVIRQNCEIHYSITHADAAARVNLEVRFSFDVVNLTEHEVDYTQYVAFEKHDNPEILDLECNSSDPNATYRKGGSEIQHTKRDEPGVVEAYGPNIKIKPNYAKQGITYRVAAAYSVEFPDKYSDIFSFGKPTINVTVTADYPGDIEFVAPPADVTTANRWEYKRVFLTGEHIHVRWFKKLPRNAEWTRGDPTPDPASQVD